MVIKIIGLGNPFRGDDGVGNGVARRLRPYQGSSIFIIEGGLAGLNLLHEMEGTDRLILIDAMSGGTEEGTIVRLTLPQDFDEIGRLAWLTSDSSTHQIGLQEALTLADALGDLPHDVIIYGIELGSLAPGTALSPKVEAAMHTVADRIADRELRLSPA
jgi:hydrogenase maturation protease